jgi:hypothetical protein
MTQATDTDIRELRDAILGFDKKLDVYIAQNIEQLKGLEVQISDLKTDVGDIKTQLRSQDNRLWSFVSALVLALIGLLAKLTFFPPGAN